MYNSFLIKNGCDNEPSSCLFLFFFNFVINKEKAKFYRECRHTIGGEGGKIRKMKMKNSQSSEITFIEKARQ